MAWFGIKNPGARIALIGPTAADCRDTIVEGQSGMLSILHADCIRDWNRSLGELILWNGTRYKTFSAEEPDRLRGPQHHRVLCDELASWQYPETFDQMMFGLRLGDNPQCVVTTTPKPTSLMRQLAKRKDGVFITFGRTEDNRDNLPAGQLAYLLDKYGGTRLGRQELDAELLDDMPGALWKRSDIDSTRVNVAPEMSRVVVAIDPAVSTNEGSDETGIVAAGKGIDGRWYVLADKSGRYTPDQWGRVAVGLYHAFKADRIIGEVNNGGDLIEANLRSVDLNVSYKSVRASRGKAIRAEPVAALYEQHKVSHVGSFPTLEDQQCLFTSDYDRTKMKYSPDRMDALVWALTELAVDVSPWQGYVEFVEQEKRLAESLLK